MQPWSVSATSGPGAKPRWPPTKGHSLCLAPPRPLVNHFRAISPLQQTNKEDNKKTKQLTNIIPRQSSFFGQSFWGHLFLVWDKEANYENEGFPTGFFSFIEITKQRGRGKNFGAIKAQQVTNTHVWTQEVQGKVFHLRQALVQTHKHIYGLCKTRGVGFQRLMKIHALKQDHSVSVVLNHQNSKYVRHNISSEFALGELYGEL